MPYKVSQNDTHDVSVASLSWHFGETEAKTGNVLYIIFNFVTNMIFNLLFCFTFHLIFGANLNIFLFQVIIAELSSLLWWKGIIFCSFTKFHFVEFLMFCFAWRKTPKRPSIYKSQFNLPTLLQSTQYQGSIKKNQLWRASAHVLHKLPPVIKFPSKTRSK